MNSDWTFGQLRLVRVLERTHLPFLRKLEDIDLVREIGFHELSGKPLSLSVLTKCGIAATATLNRRLRRLKALGVVRVNTSSRDARSKELRLDPEIYRMYASWGGLLQDAHGLGFDAARSPASISLPAARTSTLTQQ